MIWRHYKGGTYDFIGVAIVEATLEPVVVYQSTEDGTLWTRPASEFFGTVLVPGTDPGTQTPVPRFKPVGNEH